MTSDRTERMHKLICANFVRKWHMTHFVMAWLNPVYVHQGEVGLVFVFCFSLFVFRFSIFELSRKIVF